MGRQWFMFALILAGVTVVAGQLVVDDRIVRELDRLRPPTHPVLAATLLAPSLPPPPPPPPPPPLPLELP